MKAAGLRWRVAFVVALQMVRKQFLLSCAQFLRFHTKRCMGVIVGFVELGIIRYCIIF
jgi:hypothetical protein